MAGQERFCADAIVVAWFGPALDVPAHAQGCAKLPAVDVRGGKSDYRRRFYARADRGIDDIGDKPVAPCAPNSTSGFVIPVYSMAGAGIDTVADWAVGRVVVPELWQGRRLGRDQSPHGGADLPPPTARAAHRPAKRREGDAAQGHGASVTCSPHQPDVAREFGDRIVGMRIRRVVLDGPPARLDAAAEAGAANLGLENESAVGKGLGAMIRRHGGGP